MDARLSALADFLTPPPEIELVPDLLNLAEVPVGGFSVLLFLVLSRQKLSKSVEGLKTC